MVRESRLSVFVCGCMKQLTAVVLGVSGGVNMVSVDGDSGHAGHLADAVSGALEVPTNDMEMLNSLLQDRPLG